MKQIPEVILSFLFETLPTIIMIFLVGAAFAFLIGFMIALGMNVAGRLL